MGWKPFPELKRRELAEYRKDRKKARFLVDESVDPDVAKLLTDSGWNAKHATEVGLGGHSDEDLLSFAQQDDRILLTHDSDFLNDRTFPHHRNPGVIVLCGMQGNRRAIVHNMDWVLGTVGVTRELWRATRISITAQGSWIVNTFEPRSGR